MPLHSENGQRPVFPVPINMCRMPVVAGLSAMAIVDIQEYLKLIPAVNRSPQHAVWLTYDAEADTLYVNYKKPSHATDSEMTDDDIIVRYEGETVIGFTVLHASKRMKATA